MIKPSQRVAHVSLCISLNVVLMKGLILILESSQRLSRRVKSKVDKLQTNPNKCITDEGQQCITFCSIYCQSGDCGRSGQIPEEVCLIHSSVLLLLLHVTAKLLNFSGYATNKTSSRCCHNPLLEQIIGGVCLWGREGLPWIWLRQLSHISMCKITSLLSCLLAPCHFPSVALKPKRTRSFLLWL